MARFGLTSCSTSAAKNSVLTCRRRSDYGMRFANLVPARGRVTSNWCVNTGAHDDR